MELPDLYKFGIESKKLCYNRPENLKTDKVTVDKMPSFCTLAGTEWALSVLSVKRIRPLPFSGGVIAYGEPSYFIMLLPGSHCFKTSKLKTMKHQTQLIQFSRSASKANPLIRHDAYVFGNSCAHQGLQTMLVFWHGPPG
jgi:hypothetical protein